MPHTPEPATTFRTDTGRIFTRAHLGVPDVDAETWTLTVDGLVARPLRLTYEQLRALPATRLTAFHECFGSPFQPDVPVRAVANVTWTGVPLGRLLDESGVEPSAAHVRFEGLDRGDFAGRSGLTYVKDLPLTAARERVLLAYELNGEPLPPEHGYPVRAVVPRMFGTNSVKWLGRITLVETRPEHLFTTELYNRPEPGSAVPAPVRDVDVNSVLVSPRDGGTPPGDGARVAGWAWSAYEVAAVEIAVDDGPWTPADLTARGAEPVWQRFSAALPALTPGEHRVRCRATDSAGRTQPATGARNEVHEVVVRR